MDSIVFGFTLAKSIPPTVTFESFPLNPVILNDRQRIFLKSNIDEITTQEYMGLFEISRNTAVKDLNQLIDGKYINKNKNGRTVFYKLAV